MTTPAILSWSSGKDSAWALREVREAGHYEVVGALTTITAAYGRVSMHGVRESVLDRQLQAVGLPCHKLHIPAPCSNEVYEQTMSAAMAEIRAQGIEHVVFGDLFLEEIRAYREERLARVNMRAVFPLWGRPTPALAAEMIDAGVRATVTCVDPSKLDASFAGRPYDAELVADLPRDIDPCGENGEFHTVVTAGPMFRSPVSTQVCEVVHRDGFVFADVRLASEGGGG